MEKGEKGGWRERATGLTSTKRKEEKENSFGNRNLPNKEEKEEEEGSNKKGKEEEEDFIWDSVSPSLQSSSSFLITYCYCIGSFLHLRKMNIPKIDAPKHEGNNI